MWGHGQSRACPHGWLQTPVAAGDGNPAPRGLGSRGARAGARAVGARPPASAPSPPAGAQPALMLPAAGSQEKRSVCSAVAAEVPGKTSGPVLGRRLHGGNQVPAETSGAGQGPLAPGRWGRGCGGLSVTCSCRGAAGAGGCGTGASLPSARGPACPEVWERGSGPSVGRGGQALGCCVQMATSPGPRTSTPQTS